MKDIKEIKLFLEPGEQETWYNGTHYKIKNLHDFRRCEIYEDIGEKKVKWKKVDKLIQRIVIDICVNQLTIVKFELIDGKSSDVVHAKDGGSNEDK